MVPAAVAWPWPVVQRLSAPVSQLVLQCFPAAALPLPGQPVVRPRWLVVPVLPVPLALQVVPRSPPAAQALPEQAEAPTPPGEAAAGAEPVVRVQALVAELVPLVVPPTQRPGRSAGMLTVEILPPVELQETPWEPKRPDKVLPQAMVQHPGRSAGRPRADRLPQPDHLPNPVPQMVRLGLIPLPPGPVNQAPRAGLLVLLPEPVHLRALLKLLPRLLDLTMLRPRPGRQHMPQPSR